MKNTELLEALTVLEQEKNISRDSILEAIEVSLLTACRSQFKKAEKVKARINRDTCEYHVYVTKKVVMDVKEPDNEILKSDAKKINPDVKAGDEVDIELESVAFGRIATTTAKNVILQKIREEEKKVLFNEYYNKEREIVTGVVQRYMGNNIAINLGKVDAILIEKEMVPGEHFSPNDRIKLYVVEVKSTKKGPRIVVSRTHKELVRKLFESEVTEIAQGIVEIKGIAREAGSRTKMAVWSNDPDVDAVGACVGQNGSRVSEVVSELRGEKIDIINWSDNPALLIENALSPSKVISVIADAEDKTAKVVVPDYQLSLAIGKEGQNARLAARLTGYKIDIKSETQAKEAGDFLNYEQDYQDVPEEELEQATEEEYGYTDENGVFHEGFYDENGAFHEGYYDENATFHYGYFDENNAFHEGYFDEEGLFHYGVIDENGVFVAGYYDEDSVFHAGWFDENNAFHPEDEV